jgi:hypothetical protein
MSLALVGDHERLLPMLELLELRELGGEVGEEFGEGRAFEVKEEGEVACCFLGVSVSKFWWLLHRRAIAPSW